ncbi:MAG: multicopper oxidase domain-containing protein [Ktedonobacteraceae bacterium]|nr:multicopper oxidase domain-containing protein [Ktedonobacteraceae bacterium]
MSQQVREPDQDSHSTVKTTNQPQASQTAADTVEKSRAHIRRPVLSRKRWHLVGVVSLILVGLLVVGLFALQFVGTDEKSSTPQSTVNPPAAQIVPPAHQTYNAQAPAIPQGSTVNLTLTVKESLISIAPGVAYHAWTFNGTVPGPVLRVRQGQTVHFTLVNEGTMPHSIDFHAAQTPWNVNYQEVAAGKSFSFDWKANYPGIFMYHCGTPVTIYHMANGMYGAIIVDPANGWAPAQEYVLVQSEFYTNKLPDDSYSVDPNKLTSGIPDYVMFNGYADQYKENPLTAQAGQRIRLFLVNAGPTHFSAFHVIGTIFSDTYSDGNPANHMVGNQTVTVPPGGGAVVELTIPQAGLYPFVTHSFSDVGKGAQGVIKITP